MSLMDTHYNILEEINQKCNWSTPAERWRFLCARKGDGNAAIDQLRIHLKWREDHGLKTSIPTNAHTRFVMMTENNLEMNDHELWEACVSSMWAIPSYIPPSGVGKRILPHLIRFHGIDGRDLRDKERRRIAQFLPAQMDWTLATAEMYAATIAIYLYKQFNQHDDEKITILIDVRAGRGWKNPPANECLPFIKKVVGILERNFPERMSKCIVYPVPWAMTSLWKLVKYFLDSDVAKKVALISGPASEESLPPDDKLAEFIDSDTLKRLEENRVRSFCH